MKFQRTELGIKIGSLADEARRIRTKESQLNERARRRRDTIIGISKGFTPGSNMPDDLEAEFQSRCKRPLELAGSDMRAAYRIIDRIGRKAIRRYLRKGLTREQILALPGMMDSFRDVSLVQSLRRHRKGPVRHEARHAQLALAFLRGKPYERCEDKAESYPYWDKVMEIAQRFCAEDKRIVAQKFEQWSQEAASYIRGRELMTKAQFTRESMRVIA